MDFSVKKFFLSRFMFWMVLAIAGSFYLLPHIFDSDAPNRFALSRLKLGIDLRGGTYITLGVEVEKAIENRLVSESKSLDNIFKSKDLKVLPEKKEIDSKKLAIYMYFKNEDDAKVCYNMVRAEAPLLSPILQSTRVVAPLSKAEESRVRTDSVEQAVNVISGRVLNMGVEGPIVQRHGTKQIVVQIPGVDDPERIKNLITKRAHLEFKIIEATGHSKNELLDKYDGDLPSDKMIVPGEKSPAYEDDETEGIWYLVSAYPDLTGDHIVDARVKYGEFGRPVVGFSLDRSGGRKFKEVTRENMQRQLGIIIDNVVYSAPVIQAEIGSEGQITVGSGGFGPGCGEFACGCIGDCELTGGSTGSS